MFRHKDMKRIAMRSIYFTKLPVMLCLRRITPTATRLFVTPAKKVCHETATPTQLSDPANSCQARQRGGTGPGGTESTIWAERPVRAKYTVRSEDSTGPEGTIWTELCESNYQAPET